MTQRFFPIHLTAWLLVLACLTLALATCRESRKFFGSNCITVAVKRGLSYEAAELYPFDETRRALYEGVRQAVAAIPRCQPYKLSLPIQVKKENLAGVRLGAGWLLGQ